MRRIASVLLLLAVAGGPSAFPGRGRAESDTLIDEAVRDPALVEARRRFIEALERRDEAALRSLLHPKIEVGNGGEGPDDLAGLLRDRPEFAPEYIAVLKLGGRFTATDLFMIPHAAKPAYDTADESRLFARHAGVVLRKEPRAEAPVVRTIDYAIIDAKFDEGTMNKGFVEIVGPSGYAGFVAMEDVFLVGGIFIHFKKEGDRWLVVRVY